jgi:hypothetical protein
VPIKSPFVGPSPSANAQYNYTQGGKEPSNIAEDSKTTGSLKQQSSASGASTLNNAAAHLLNQHQYKKCHSASIPIYISEHGFLQMLTVNPETNYSPLETFLASIHLKKKLLKTFQSDAATFAIKNPDAHVFKTHFVEFQLVNEISNANYQAFSLHFTQINAEVPVDALQRYFNTRILCPPYRSTVAVSFFNLLTATDLRVLKELTQMLEYELSPHAFKFNWRVKFSWTMPNGYLIKNSNKTNFVSFYQNSLHGFLKRDRYYFLVYLFNQQRVQGPHSPHSLLLLVGYDALNSGIALEILRPINDNSPVYNAYEAYLNNLINVVKQKGLASFIIPTALEKFSLFLTNNLGFFF